jgi:hypothetical protein
MSIQTDMTATTKWELTWHPELDVCRMEWRHQSNDRITRLTCYRDGTVIEQNEDTSGEWQTTTHLITDSNQTAWVEMLRLYAEMEFGELFQYHGRRPADLT